jgi:subtilisin family serine protease
MKYFSKLITLIVILFCLLHIKDGRTDINENKSLYVKNHFIIKFKNDTYFSSAAGNTAVLTASETIKYIASKSGIKVTKIKHLFPPSINSHNKLAAKYGMDKYYVIHFDGEKDVKEACKEFEKNRNIEFAEPDYIGEAAGKKDGSYIKPNDEFFGRQWGLYNDGTVRTTTGKSGKMYADMNIVKGWEIETGSDNIIVAILDSGVKPDHPDLKGRIWVNTKEIRNGKDDDGNGYIDDINGWNFAYETSNVKDDGGHGTNISGTIGASTNNNLGYAGIDQNCMLMICKNLDDENLGEYSWWSESLYYAANNGAKVINMSEGGYDYSKTLENAINYAYDSGCLIVASMMNKNNNDKYYPACLKNVLAVGATDTDDGRCKQFTWGGGSNWGRHIAVVAPGNRVYGLDYKDNYNYDVYWSGTSQATAYVTGIASLLLAQDISRKNTDLYGIITSSAKDRVGDPREDETGWDEFYGYGRVDLFSALTVSGIISPNEKREKEDTQTNDREYEKSGSDGKAKAVDRESSKQNDTDSNDDRRAKKVDR